MSNGSSVSFEHVIYQYVIPLELVCGLLAQLVNLAVLSQKAMGNNVAYRNYLRSLSLAYLIVSPIMLLSIIRKLNSHMFESCLLCMSYFAHLETYSINLLLFSANFIIVAISAEALHSLLRPFSASNTSTQSFSRRVLTLIVVLTSVAWLPLLFLKRLQRVQHYDAAANRTVVLFRIVTWSHRMKTLKHVCSSVVEVCLLLVICTIYIITFVRHKQISAWHNKNATSSTGRTRGHLRANSRKALITCSAPVLAYIISNLGSAIKELLYLCDLHVGKHLPWFVAAANAMLVFNFTLNVLLQLLARSRYRKAFMNKMLRLGYLTNSLAEGGTLRSRCNQTAPPELMARKKTPSATTDDILTTSRCATQLQLLRPYEVEDLVAGCPGFERTRLRKSTSTEVLFSEQTAGGTGKGCVRAKSARRNDHHSTATPIVLHHFGNGLNALVTHV